MATSGSIHPVAAGKGRGDPLRALCDGSKVSTIFSLLSANGDITRIVSVYHIPPTVLCRRAKTDEPACDDSSGDLVIYEEMLEAGLKFPMPSSLCHVLHYFSLTPGRLAPNGWRILLGFLALWRRVHHEDAAPVVFHASYNLSESPVPNRGWYYFTPKGGKLLTGLRSNCHSWKSRFLFIGGEWASERDRALVPVRWSDAKKLDSPVLSTGQEEKLQRVRAYPEKDLGVLLPKDNSVAGGLSSGSPLKRKRRNRQMIGARLSSRSKVAREDGDFSGTSPSASHDVTPSTVTPPIATYVTPPTVTPPVVTHACFHQASSSAATPESPTPASPFAHRLPSPRSGAPSWAGPMLGNPQVIREKLGRFVFPPEVTQINNLGTAGVMNTFLEGLAQVSTASICLLSRAHHNTQLRQDNENMLKELSAAQEKIASLEAAGKVLDADFVAARERATGFENELSAARERATEAEAELVKVRERASLSEAELTQTCERAALRETALETELKEANDRASQAGLELEEGIADAFIDGYEELRKKISSAFPAIDFSGFVPTEAPEDSSGYFDEDDDDEAGDEFEDEDEDGEDFESD